MIWPPWFAYLPILGLLINVAQYPIIRSRAERIWILMGALLNAALIAFWLMIFYSNNFAPCGDNCLRPGEEIGCTVDLRTGSMKCTKGPTHAEGEET